MTFRLDLDLDGMLALAGFDKPEFHDYPDRTRVDTLLLPCRYTFQCRVSSVDDVGFEAEAFRAYFMQFSIRFLKTPYRVSIPLFSETFSNILEHGGEAVKDIETVVEAYHPSADPSRCLIRISNANEAEWDFQRITEQEGRGGFMEYRRPEALVSYANGGKEFLALIKLE